jgi:hypothetical protein
VKELKKQALLKQRIGRCYVESAMSDPVTALERKEEEEEKTGGYVFKC